MAKVIKSIKRFWPFYLMLIPGTVYLIINNYIPMTGIVVAFKQYNIRDGLYFSPNIGFKNFEFLFKAKDAWLIVRNTLLYNLAFIVIGTVLAIAVAGILGGGMGNAMLAMGVTGWTLYARLASYFR